MGISPCDLIAVAALSTSVEYFQLQCTLEQVAQVENGVYVPELFGGKPCGVACATTDMETLGTGAQSPGNVLYSPEAATRTMDALVSYHHCRCRVKASVFNLACDCSLWESIRDFRSSGQPPRLAFVHFMATLKEAEDASSAVLEHVRAVRHLVEQELKALCANGSGPDPHICTYSAAPTHSQKEPYPLK